MRSHQSLFRSNVAMALAAIVIIIAFGGREARALELTAIGVVANSGSDGSTVVRGTIARSGGGVAMDAQGRIFVGGGDRILALSRDGRQLWTIDLPEADWVLAGPTFTIAGGQLYFMAGKPRPYDTPTGEAWWRFAEANLCRVRMVPGAKPEVLQTAKDLQLTHPAESCDTCLSTQPGTDRVYLSRGFYTPTREFVHDIFEVASDGKLTPLVSKGGTRASVDENGDFIVTSGAYIEKYDRAGNPVAGYKSTKLQPFSATPTQWSGNASLTRDAIWECALLGFIGRFTRDGNPNPGVACTWQLALRSVMQIIDGHVPEQYYIRCVDGLYVAEMRNAQLRVLRRFGSMVSAKMLQLRRDGYIVVVQEAPNGFVWFDFDNPDPAAAPYRGSFDGSPYQMLMDENERIYGYSRDGDKLYFYRFDSDPNGTQHLDDPSFGKSDRNPTTAVAVGKYVFSIEAKTDALLRAHRDDPYALTEMKLGEAPAPVTSLSAIGNLLLVARGGSVSAFEVPENGELKAAWKLSGAGAGPASATAFGAELHVATSGNLLVIADTLRHRILLYSAGEDLLREPTIHNQFGQTDQAGSELQKADQPSILSICGGKVVVYDRGNQRILKLRVR